MTEEKERLSKTEYDKVGEMLLELIAECPYIPEDAQIRYQQKDIGKCIYIITAGGSIKKRNVLGGFTAELIIQIANQSFPKTNAQIVNAQSVVDNIVGWLEDVKNLPSLTKDRKFTKITASPSFSDLEEVGVDKSIVFASNITMEYEKEAHGW